MRSKNKETLIASFWSIGILRQVCIDSSFVITYARHPKKSTFITMHSTELHTGSQL